MENATKALLMAGGLLIAILVASFMIFVLRKAGQMTAEYDVQRSENELASFNGQFEVYDKNDNTFFDIITVSNLAYDVNQKNNNDTNNSVIIKIFLTNSNVANYYTIKPKEPNEPKPMSKNHFLDSDGNEKYMYDVLQDNDFAEIDDSNPDVLIYKNTFKCEKVLYNDITGKVREMHFRLN